MKSRIVPAPIPTYDYLYSVDYSAYPCCYVYSIKRDELMEDLISKLLK